MIVCSCNRLTHHDVEAAVDGGATRPKEIYASKGCKAQCGNCTSGIVCLLRQALMQRGNVFDLSAGLAAS
ncbi:(2Fe-2S)-binding protein [Ameyamaea chiangmaiensis]|uniref:Bacterioferritin-associated ferredoxin n=1 Tax=Ameyamaea chiangmaiensis TaxID=442969 RepID=A0A850P986_9PROT|nr:(2Fe-2S)-binding protein [Ameyamaea chiangmaiensis]MBS4074562.1 (2Fe-2S)-binding protein [Ameyamaea chiangmaiensis]NVN39523.1 (2Fe-2S)-binding protein [Ameyamaea chiangmaiensis]